MSNKLLRTLLFLAGATCCIAAALPYCFAQDKRLPNSPIKLASAQEIANRTERSLWKYTFELVDPKKQQVLASHDGSSPFDAAFTLAPPPSTESHTYHLTVQQYRLDGENVHLLIDIAHRVLPTSSNATRTEWKSENIRFETVVKLGQQTTMTINDWHREGDDRPLQFSVLVGKVTPE